MSPRMRKTVAAMKAVHDAPTRSPWIYAPIGVVVMAGAALLWYTTPAMWKVACGVGVVGLGMIPGAIPFVVGQLKPAVALFQKTRNGTGGTPSDGNSP